MNEPNEPRFLCDCMLGKLARYLRLYGYDTSFHRDADDDELIRISRREDRILLTSDLALSKRRIRYKTHYLATRKTEEQLKALEKEYHLDLQGSRPPRCTLCNGEAAPVEKTTVIADIPIFVYRTKNDFRRCEDCGRVYWEGTHTQNFAERDR